MSVKVVIPARYSSSRLPGKILLDIESKTVIAHVIERCLEAGVDKSDIFVATDSNLIVNSLRDYDESINVVLTSVHHESGTDRVNEVALLKGWSSSDLVVNVQGDEPLIPPQLIADLVNFTKKNPEFDICTAVGKVNNVDDFTNPNIVKCVSSSSNAALYFSRAAIPLCRDEPNNFSLANKHIGIYSYKVSSLLRFCSYPESPLEKIEKLEQLRAIENGMSIGVSLFNGEVHHGIDTIEDYYSVIEAFKKGR